MANLKDIKNTENLVESVESRTLQTCQEVLCLSDGLMECEEESPNKPPFSINYLEYYDSHEPVTSWIIRHIFAYSYNGRLPYFELFAKTFLQDIGFKPEWIDTPIIDKDHEYKSIDILIRDKQYAVIIENKLKGAAFQLNQLARYIATMREEGYTDEQIFVVVLPKYDIDNNDLSTSVWRLPKDWKSTNQSRKCRVDSHICWCDSEGYRPKAHCKKCESLKELFECRTLFIHKEFSTWLYECIDNNTVGLPEDELRKQYVLKSATLQFVDFLNAIYQTRENDKYKMDIKEFFSEQLKLEGHDIAEQLSLVESKKEDVDELVSQLDSFYWSKIEEYISDIEHRHNVQLVHDDNNKFYFHYDFRLERKNIKLSLGYEDGSNFCQIEANGRLRIPEIIKNDSEISEELNDKNNNNNCIRRWDSYKESLLRFDRILGRLIEFQNNDKRK